MKKIFSWSEWSIATKILFMFLGLSVVSMGLVGIITNNYITDMGAYALDTSSGLGQRAISDSTNHLNQLGEEMIIQKSRDIAKQVEMYLNSRPPMTIEGMRTDPALRQIVVQPIGATGYTTLIDPENAEIIIHKYPGQEKKLDALQTILPSFWTLMKSSVAGRTEGYYDWLEVDGTITNKYAGIEPVISANGEILNLWATAYIPEFSLPAELTKEEINTAIKEATDHINKNVTEIQNIFFISFTVLIIAVVAIALLLSRVITNPIKTLKAGADAVGKGILDYKLSIKNKDEIGDLADSFNSMATALKNTREQSQKTAAENIEKEKQIQENLRIYMKKLGEAQEEERKRVSRELHDDAIQALVVVSRELDDLASGRATQDVRKIHEEVRRIIKSLRNFSQELRPSVLDDLGLVPAITWLVSELGKNHHIHTETQISGQQRSLSPETEMMLFRITQEALTNISRHSKGNSAIVKLDFSEDIIKLTILDNGQGFEPPQKYSDLTRIGKLGLTGMRERVQLLGGTFDIRSGQGRGTELTIVIPQKKV